MKNFIALIFLMFSSLSLADTFIVKNYTWCNGPSAAGATCALSSNWHAVQLSYIKTISVDFNSAKQPLSLTDVQGNSWSVNLAECHNSSSEKSGCTNNIDTDGTTGVAIDYSEWSPNSGSQFLSFNFLSDTQIEFFGPPGNTLFILNVEKLEK